MFWTTFRVEVISWRGPDLNNVTEVVPLNASSSVVNEDEEFFCDCYCGSDGEVAHDHSTGNQFASRIVNGCSEVTSTTTTGISIASVGRQAGLLREWCKSCQQRPALPAGCLGVIAILLVNTQKIGENHFGEGGHYFETVIGVIQYELSLGRDDTSSRERRERRAHPVKHSEEFWQKVASSDPLLRKRTGSEARCCGQSRLEHT